MTVYPRHLQPGEEPGYGHELSSDKFKFLRIGRITRVDNERGLVDLEWLDHFGRHENVRLPSAYSSIRGTMRGMPEIDSIVICGFIRQGQTLEDPIIIGFLDINYENALAYKFIRNKTSENLKEINTIREKIGYDAKRSKRRKLYSGEIQAESQQGAELTLDDNVYLSDKALNEIEICSADRSIRLSSRQYYNSSCGSRSWSGLITREPINGTTSIQPTILPNGQKVVIVTESTNPYHLGGNAYVEHRIETYDKSRGQLNVTEVNSGSDVSSTRTDMQLVMGTLVGNDKSDVQRYSRILRPQIFGLPESAEGRVDEIECNPEEFNTLAGVFQLKSNKTGATITIDKQGHLFTHFPASTGQHPMGSGRSWEGNFDGSIKLVVGKNIAAGRSVIIDTKGGWKEVLGGFDNENQRSKETIARKSIYTEVLSPDEDDNAYILKTSGNLQYNIAGDINTNLDGNQNTIVSGRVSEEIMGTRNGKVVSDVNNVFGANYKEVIIKHTESSIGATRKIVISGVETEFGQPPLVPNSTVDLLDIKNGSRDEKYLLGNLRRQLTLGDMTAELTAGSKEDSLLLGNRILSVQLGDIEHNITTGNKKTNITTGNHENTITAGNNKTNITTGNDETTVGTGNISEDITLGNNSEAIITGNKEIEITTGNFTLKITAGNIEVKTTAGTVEVASDTQTVTVSGLLKATLKANVKAEVLGATVDIGQLPTRGGVVCGLPGVPTHLDFLTGLPLVGSKTVAASI